MTKKLKAMIYNILTFLVFLGRLEKIYCVYINFCEYTTIKLIYCMKLVSTFLAECEPSFFEQTTHQNFISERFLTYFTSRLNQTIKNLYSFII